MDKFKDLKVCSIVAILLLLGCENPNASTNGISSFPNIDSLLISQPEILREKSLLKEVWLDGQRESKELQMDSLQWEEELSFLKEINPNLPEYVGAFKKTQSEGNVILTLGEKENGSLKTFSYRMENGNITSIDAVIHEDKDVYAHHREINLQITQGQIKSYKVDGYQKIMLKDTIRFKIEGRVLD